jgi:hypothetical protein
VTFIDQVFPWAKTQIPGTSHSNFLAREHAGAVAGLLELVTKIPDELLTLNAGDYGEFACGVAAIRDRLLLWQNQQNPNIPTYLSTVPGVRDVNPVTLIRQALAKCPDESPAPGTSELSFITDTALRTNLRNDVGAINRALANGEWKAATVLAGSAAEALLLWALRQKLPADITTGIAAARSSGDLKTKPDADLDKWVLHEYLEVAANLGVIKPNTAKQTRLAKDFRNFIHPGVAQRLGEKCDRATALSAVAGMEHIVRDFTP